MPVSLNLDWGKIRQEINRLSDLDTLKSEIQRVRDEIKGFDYSGYLSPTAQKRVKDFEVRYNRLMKSVGSAQRQLDREFNKLIRQVQKHKETAEERINSLRTIADEQKEKIDKLTKDLTSKVNSTVVRSAAGRKTSKKKSSKKATSTSKKKTAKKTTARKKTSKSKKKA